MSVQDRRAIRYAGRSSHFVLEPVQARDDEQSEGEDAEHDGDGVQGFASAALGIATSIVMHSRRGSASR